MVIDQFLSGLGAAVALGNLLACVLGVTAGMFVGVLPGLGPLTAMSLLLPFTYGMEPGAALMMMGGIWYGAAYGGAISAILLNIPGTALAAVTTLDGHPLARQGRAGPALLLTALASFVGGAIGIALTMVLAPFLSQQASLFGPPESAALVILCLVAGAGVGGGPLHKGLAMAVVGMILGTVGTDVISGDRRLTFGMLQLSDGLSLVPLAVGIFGLSEVILQLGRLKSGEAVFEQKPIGPIRLSRKDMRVFPGAAVRGSVIGAIVGILPGIGPTVATYLAYAAERRLSRYPERFGQGAVEGVVAPEAANNASDLTAFIPTLALGIPGSAAMSIILTVLMVHGLTPGPAFIAGRPDLFWGLIASFWIGNIMLLVLNVPLIGIWTKLLQIPSGVLYPLIVILMSAGVFAAEGNVFDLVVMALAGLLGASLRLFGYQMAPLLLGFILGPLLEQHLRRSLLIAHGDPAYLSDHPLALAIVALPFLVILLLRAVRHRNARRLTG
jgi:TctA family transporter